MWRIFAGFIIKARAYAGQQKARALGNFFIDFSH